jgi:hypothetical protein
MHFRYHSLPKRSLLMYTRPVSALILIACSGQPVVEADTGSQDAPICEYEVSYHCDYRPTEVYANCTDYSGQAFDYLDAQSIESSGQGMAEVCESNGASWGEGSCPRDDTWVGVCVSELAGTVGLVYGSHYYSEPELTLPDGTQIIYDDATASASCAETAGTEWCNEGS